MPCYVPEPPNSIAHVNAEGDMTKSQFEAVLCALFSKMETLGSFESFMNITNWDEAGVPRSFVKKWWEKHKARDAERRRRERERDAEIERNERLELARLRAKYGDD